MEVFTHKIEAVSVNKILDLPFNRNKKEEHVKKLTKSLATVGILRAPVLVKTRAITGKLELYTVDGQHLIESLKRVGKAKVSAFIVETDSLNEIVSMMALLNNVQQKWTIVNYVNAYCGLGAKDYFTLKEHSIKYGFSINVSAMILSGNIGGIRSNGLNSITTGSFKAGAPDSEVLTQNLIDVCSLIKADSTKFHNAYINFYRTNSTKYDHGKMLKKLRENTESFKNIPHDSGYIFDLLTRVYN